MTLKAKIKKLMELLEQAAMRGDSEAWARYHAEILAGKAEAKRRKDRAGITPTAKEPG